jgi:beta-glucosidase
MEFNRPRLSRLPISSIFAAPFAALCMALLCAAHTAAHADAIDTRVQALLKRMTLEEKAGQLNQYNGHWETTGPNAFKGNHEQAIASGQVGSMLNVPGAQRTRAFQEVAMRSRLKIPLLFGRDVIHGYKTTFPIPLAEAASFDLVAIEGAARIAATEAAASGQHWTFAPMVDIARDPRWGRVLEGAGEDTYLASKIAYARVKGFQGHALGDLDAVLACAKHFAAYGAALAGRDYNSVDMSERQLLETYLPPFKAALDAGAATFMNAFNDVNGVPATGNRYLQRDILKGSWGFKGIVVSDWGSIAEMQTHGHAASLKDAARLALLAGSDVDMEGKAYLQHLPALVREGAVPMKLLDDAVARVLRKKFELGLFDDPYRFSNTQRETEVLNRPEHRQAARSMAAKSIVLLKNEGNLLPLKKDTPTIAFIGPLVKAGKDNHGAWAITMPEVNYEQFIVTQWRGVQERLAPGSRLLYAQGCDVACTSRDGFSAAVAVAQQADVVVVSVGESADMSGEARSRTQLGLPGEQEALIQALHATGKPVVVLVNAGRPLIFNWTAEHVPAIVYTWWLGSEAGNAIADVLFGDHNPAGRLPISFPRSVGQIPIYYNHLNTGRPVKGEGGPTHRGFVSHYIDELRSPRYAFGHGLSYTAFAYSDLKLDRTAFAGAKNERIVATLTVTNTGQRAGAEVVQLYLRDPVASVVRPVKELKDFRRVELAAGQSQELRFEIDREKLSFVNTRLQWVAEPGEFELMVGASSSDIRLRSSFQLTK